MRLRNAVQEQHRRSAAAASAVDPRTRGLNVEFFKPVEHENHNPSTLDRPSRSTHYPGRCLYTRPGSSEAASSRCTTRTVIHAIPRHISDEVVNSNQNHPHKGEQPHACTNESAYPQPGDRPARACWVVRRSKTRRRARPPRTAYPNRIRDTQGRRSSGLTHLTLRVNETRGGPRGRPSRSGVGAGGLLRGQRRHNVARVAAQRLTVSQHACAFAGRRGYPAYESLTFQSDHQG
jgi:hypothetical protein